MPGSPCRAAAARESPAKLTNELTHEQIVAGKSMTDAEMTLVRVDIWLTYAKTLLLVVRVCAISRHTVGSYGGVFSHERGTPVWADRGREEHDGRGNEAREGGDPTVGPCLGSYGGAGGGRGFLWARYPCTH